MNRMLLVAGVLLAIGTSATAQQAQDVQGDKLRVVTGKNNSVADPAATNSKPAVQTHVHTMHRAPASHIASHHTYHHRYAKKGTHTTHHYAHAGTHKGHATAMHHAVKHHHIAAHAASHTHSYAAAAPATGANPPQPTQKIQQPKMSREELIKKNKDMPTGNYPGASNAGWDDGTNGRGGTASQDGKIVPNKP